jgi:transcriptional regulator with XRE-family HTH domain
MVDVKQHVGIKVKAARRRLGLTQAQLAEAIDKTVETISNIERGHSLTSIETLQLLSERLKVPLAEFLEGLEKARSNDRRRVELEQKMGLLLQSLPDQDTELALDLIAVLARRRRRRKPRGLSPATVWPG